MYLTSFSQGRIASIQFITDVAESVQRLCEGLEMHKAKCTQLEEKFDNF